MEKETRPWGEFSVLHEGPGFKVKSLVVRAGSRLSMQYHHERDERWTVVRGTARVLSAELGTESSSREIDLAVGDTISIPRGRVHRLTNPSSDERDELEIIEVQLGACREDDIVRLADDHGRA